MLGKIESFYLYILRVVILAAATIALLLVVLGTVRAFPAITAHLGMSPSEALVQNADLGSYIAEKKASGADTGTTSSSTVAPPRISPDIQEAGRLLAGYTRTKMGNEMDQSAVTAILQSNQDGLPLDRQPAYGESLKSLMAQLSRSTGKPLTPDRVGDLVTWHLERFKASIAAADAKKAAEDTAALQALAVAGGALVTFLLIVFSFLFVKIERNLRLVRVVGVDAQNMPT